MIGDNSFRSLDIGEPFVIERSVWDVTDSAFRVGQSSPRSGPPVAGFDAIASVAAVAYAPIVFR